MDIQAIDQLRIVLDPIGQTGLALALMLVIFGVGLGLSVDDFVSLKREARPFYGGVATQIIGLPLLTIGLLHLIDVPRSIALGMIVVACCPGGAVSNLLSYLGRGNVAYSVSLTATSSVLAAVLTPASILFWSHRYAPTAALLASIDVNPWLFLGQTMALLAVPIALGMMLATRAPDIAGKLRRATTTVGALVLLAVIVYGLVYFYPVLGPAMPWLFGIAILHNACAFALGAAAAAALQTPPAVRRALMFEIGIQNTGIALIILVGQLEGLGGAAAMAGVWGVWHIAAGALIVVGLRTFDRFRYTA
ncbi:MAG: bile acid:sodium symporter [Woeseiaceae bacterium]|nr:bile acid:sodium symporter [Woeseiaceae bacterium]